MNTCKNCGEPLETKLVPGPDGEERRCIYCYEPALTPKANVNQSSSTIEETIAECMHWWEEMYESPNE